MVCHVKHGLLIGNCMIGYPECILRSHLIGHLHDCVSRKSLHLLLVLQNEGYLGFFHALYLPHSRRSTFSSTMQIVLVIIHIQLVFHSIQCESGIGNTVSVTSDSRSKIAGILFVWSYLIISANDITGIPVSVFYKNGYNRCAKIRSGKAHSPPVGNRI